MEDNRRGCMAIVLRTVEVALLLPAFLFLIPPIPSNTDQRYRLMPGLAFGATLFGISLALACRRGGERWDIAIVKLLMFCGLGVVIYVRVWDY
jgi:hypothetical protein